MKNLSNFKYQLASAFFLFSIFLLPFENNARTLFAVNQDSAAAKSQIISSDSLKTQLSDSTAGDSLKQAAAKAEKKIPAFQFHPAKSAFTHFSLQQKEFDSYIYRHLGDLIRQLPGVELNDYVSTGLPAYLHLRGSALNQPAIFIDGFPVSHPQFGAYDLNLLPSQGFELIEIDPENQTTGYSVPFGAIQLKTRQYSLKKPYTELVWHNGKHGDSEVDVTFGLKLGKETSATGGYTNKNSAGRHPHSEYLAQKIRFQIQSRLHANWDMNYKVFNTKAEFKYPGPAFWLPGILNLDARQKSVLWHHFLTLRGDLTGDYQEDLNLKFYYNSLFQDFRDKNFHIQEIYHNRFLGTQIESYFPLFSRELTVGGRTEFRWLSSETVKKTLFFDASVYGRYQYPLLPLLNLVTNFSLDVNHKFGVFFTPQFILQRQFEPGIGIALEYQHARRLPDFFELYWNYPEAKVSADTTRAQIDQNRLIYTGNPNLAPEYINNISFNLNLKPWSWLTMNASPYFRSVQNFICFHQALDTESPAFINQNQAFFYGYDQRLEIQIFQDLKIDMTFHYLISRDENKKGLPDQPNLTASGVITYRRNFFQGNLKTSFHLAAHLLGERWNLINGNYPFPANYYSANLSHGGYEPTLDLKAVANIRDMDIYLSFENLLGRKYHYLAGYPMREMAYYWGINWKFWD